MILRFALLLALSPCLAAEEFVPWQPTQARLFLRTPAEAPPVEALEISTGEWRPASHEADTAKRERLADVYFPITWWRWREFRLSFTPAHTGTVELDLNGPWAEHRPGVLRQQEVLWDSITASGASVENGGFEEREDGRPRGWDSPWRPYPAPDAWPLAKCEPLAGKHAAASWHGRPLVGRLAVTAGTRVTLTLHARAATPPDFKAPARLPADTPAHRACARLKRGVNFGNGWEAAPGTWGIRYEVADVDHAADEGFDHIRMPVAWHFYIKDGVIDPKLLADLEPLLKRALERKMIVLLNWHHHDALVKDPEAHRAAFATEWKVIARHFRDWPAELYLELLNEPHGALDHDALTRVHADAIAAIREVSPQRILLANPPQWAAVSGLDRFFLPDADDRIIPSIHSYEPFQFTHQRASWVGYQDLRGISYPGPPQVPVVVPESLKSDHGIVSWIAAYNTRQGSENPCTAAAFEALLDDAVAWSRHFGRPVHIGEFGAYREADAASRSRYVRDFRRAAEKRGLPWAMWDWKAGFAYWDPEKSSPLLRDELFGK